MGLIFEDLIRRFNEASNETAGDHFTPREVIRLMVNLLFTPDSQILRTKGIVKTLYDPACGTGGMFSVAEEYLRDLNPDAPAGGFRPGLQQRGFRHLLLRHDDQGPEPREHQVRRQLHPGRPAGHRSSITCWPIRPSASSGSRRPTSIEREHEEQGFKGRFGAGLPRINDGSLLFIMHMISKMKPEGSRLAIVFNGSPLFTGDAGSGESEIRRWIIESDWLEAIVALPTEMFYNTGIATYIWILTNRKRKERRGKVQLINATDLFVKMRKSLGNKRNELSNGNIAEIVELYGDVTKNGRSKLFDNSDFGYRQITVERPLRLAFQVTQERIALSRKKLRFRSSRPRRRRARKVNGRSKKDRALQHEIVAMLEGHGRSARWT